MEAKELRIGNYVTINNDLLLETKNQIYKVYGYNLRFDFDFPDSKGVISLDHIDSIRTYSQFDEFIQPIQLTEEWLLKFGFKKVSDNYITVKSFHFENINCWIYLLEDGFEFEFITSNERFNMFRTYKYVHQLQNLYFALTRDELTIK